MLECSIVTGFAGISKRFTPLQEAKKRRYQGHRGVDRVDRK